jgi:hypothetical protein
MRVKGKERKKGEEKIRETEKAGHQESGKGRREARAATLRPTVAKR